MTSHGELNDVASCP